MRLRITFSSGDSSSPRTPVPKCYAGPLARLKDSAEFPSGSSGDSLYPAKPIAGASTRTSIAITAARDGSFSPGCADECEVSARPCTLVLDGRTHCAAPDQELVAWICANAARVTPSLLPPGRPTHSLYPRLRRGDRLRRFDAGLKIGEFRHPACKARTFYTGFDEFLDVRWHEVQPAELAA